MINNKIICTNCGIRGHVHKKCTEPSTSFGIINIYIPDKNIQKILVEKFNENISNKISWNVISDKYDICHTLTVQLSIINNDIYDISEKYIVMNNSNCSNILSYCLDNIYFMIVSRKFSLGFIDFVRGKYDVSDVISIINLFRQMYDEEIEMIKNNDYDDLLFYFANRNGEEKNIFLDKIYEGKYSLEYCEAKIKFNKLKNCNDDYIKYGLDFFIDNIKPEWEGFEWGFPKGRRESYTEENIQCACREFCEETGYDKTQFFLLDKIKPINEYINGTNNVKYKHVYYLSIDNTDKKIPTKYDENEIGSIKWLTYNNVINIFRPYHINKKYVITQVFIFIVNELLKIYSE